MAPITRFEDIEGWQKSRDLQEAFTRVVEVNPFKNWNLQDQMWRCTDSAMSNISEGFDAGSNPEFVRFLNMAYRSLTEFRSHLYECRIGGHLTHLQCETFREMARQAQSKIGGFIRYLKAHPHGPPKKSSS